MRLKALVAFSGNRFSIRRGQSFETNTAEGKRLIERKMAVPSTEKAVVNFGNPVENRGKAPRKVAKKAAPKKAVKKKVKKKSKKRG